VIFESRVGAGIGPALYTTVRFPVNFKIIFDRFFRAKKSPGDKGRVSGAEHVPDDVHPERTPLREVERGKTKSN
jgi:hypothetical protein